MVGVVVVNELRDHSEPCKHKLDSGWDTAYQTNSVWRCTSCPGGRVVTIDWEAAEDAIPDWIVQNAAMESLIGDALVRLIVEAAIGDTDKGVVS